MAGGVSPVPGGLIQAFVLTLHQKGGFENEVRCAHDIYIVYGKNLKY
jgi:hypothetical protein